MSQYWKGKLYLRTYMSLSQSSKHYLMSLKIHSRLWRAALHNEIGSFCPQDKKQNTQCWICYTSLKKDHLSVSLSVRLVVTSWHHASGMWYMRLCQCVKWPIFFLHWAIFDPAQKKNLSLKNDLNDYFMIKKSWQLVFFRSTKQYIYTNCWSFSVQKKNKVTAAFWRWVTCWCQCNKLMFG